ncbi:MAG: hypothetical protein H0T85_00055 [Geodermatophilaceae bacterium]|nr:hypothetical protein [Geodermatophilaceae bacterium]
MPDVVLPEPELALLVVDIDGVVADVRHRLHHIGSHPRRWEDFFAAAAEDPVLPEGLAIVTDIPPGSALCWLTGRPERNRALTEDWLRRHGMPDSPLLMRADRDHRPARQAKREHLLRLRRTHRVALMVDDDPLVLEMLAELGIASMLADWLPFSPRLHQAQERQGRT